MLRPRRLLLFNEVPQCAFLIIERNRHDLESLVVQFLVRRLHHGHPGDARPAGRGPELDQNNQLLAPLRSAAIHPLLFGILVGLEKWLVNHPAPIFLFHDVPRPCSIPVGSRRFGDPELNPNLAFGLPPDGLNCLLPGVDHPALGFDKLTLRKGLQCLSHSIAICGGDNLPLLVFGERSRELALWQGGSDEQNQARAQCNSQNEACKKPPATDVLFHAQRKVERRGAAAATASIGTCAKRLLPVRSHGLISDFALTPQLENPLSVSIP
jgi:hypothetical protein